MTNPVHADQINALEMALELLPPSDVEFAKKLIHGFKTFGGLTPKQAPWVVVLIDRALGKAPTKPQATEVGDLSGVYGLFQKAKQHLKFPKIRLEVDGQAVVLAVAGDKSKYAGAIQLTDGEKFGFNRYFGRVEKSGQFLPSMKEQAAAPKIGAVLKALAADPLKVAAEHGKLTGYCCFCNKSLSDPQSAAAGYGPVCADNWGLKAAYKAAEQVF